MPEINVGDTVTARWSHKATGERQPAKAEESHQSATGRILTVADGKVTLDCNGPKVVIERELVVS